MNRFASLAGFVGVLGHASSEFFAAGSGIAGPELSVWRFLLGGAGLIFLALMVTGPRNLLRPAGVRSLLCLYGTRRLPSFSGSEAWLLLRTSHGQATCSSSSPSSRPCWPWPCSRNPCRCCRPWQLPSSPVRYSLKYTGCASPRCFPTGRPSSWKCYRFKRFCRTGLCSKRYTLAVP